MPAIREEFGASETQVGWIATGFMLVMAIGVSLYGRLSASSACGWLHFGPLDVRCGGLICAFVPNLPVLVFDRIVQAAGDAAIRLHASSRHPWAGTSVIGSYICPMVGW